MLKNTTMIDNFVFSDFTLETVTTRFARLMAEYSSFQSKVKQRISKLEKSTDEAT